MKKCYLITTAHLEDGLWFLDEEDFRTGMNYVAIQASRSKVIVLAFILMSNHLHFILYGSWEDVQDFVNGLKSRYAKYFYNNNSNNKSKKKKKIQKKKNLEVVLKNS